MSALRIALVVVLALLTLASPAAADDRGVSDAWDSQDPQFRELSKSMDREIKRWKDRGFTRDGKILRLMKRGETLSRRVVAALEAQQPSTPTGAQARDLAIKSTAHLAEYFVADRKWARAVRPGGTARSRRLARESERLYDLSIAESKQAKTLFVSLGLD